VERANGMILDALKKKVFDKSEKLTGKWIKELPYVVWSLRTQPSFTRKNPILHGVWVGSIATSRSNLWSTQINI
jgi:ribosome biogenesis protein Nip4